MRVTRENAGFSVRTATYADCRERLLAFRNANRDTVRDHRYMDWRYLARPTDKQPIIVWAETGGATTIGMAALIPHRYAIEGKVVTAGLLGDLSVLTEWRGRSVAQSMINYLGEAARAHGLDTCLVLPTDAAARVLDRCGWILVSKIRRHVKFLDLAPRLRRYLPAPAARVTARIASGAMSFITSAPRAGDDDEFDVVGAPDTRFDTLWERVSRGALGLACRDKSHLDWRFARHPDGTFRFYCLRDAATLRGYVVFRIDGGECRIDDMLCETEHVATLLARFCHYVRTQLAASSLSIKTNSEGPVGRSLRRLGFFRRPDYQLVMRAPGGFETSPRAGWFFTFADKDV